MRILHSIDSVNIKGGGPIEALIQISIVNQKQGHTIEVVSLDDPGSDWVRNCRFKCHAMGPSMKKYGYTSRLLPWLRAHRHQYDVIIVHGLWQYSSFGIWRALHATNTPYFVFPHGMLDPWFKHTYPMKHLKKWLYWPWGEYRVLRDAKAVLFTCESERELARQSFWLYCCKEMVVSFGTAAPPDEAEEQRRAFFAEFPRLMDKRCLLFLGRLHVKKGPDLVLRAFAKILRSRGASHTAALHLVMAGPGDFAYSQSLHLLAEQLGLQDRITWAGMLTGQIKWGAFRAAEAFVLPSHQENFGIAVAEALACGLPVLISNKVNIWHEIEQANAGFVALDNDLGTELLLQQWLDADQERWASMSRNASRLFAEKFDVERAAPGLISVLEKRDARIGSGGI